MRKALRIVLWLCLTLLLLTGIGLWLVYRATQYVPEFYQQALAIPLPAQHLRQASDQLERQVLELHNDARRTGRWEAEFTEEQINAWLMADLERKLPHALPRGLHDPRVRIAPQGVQVACQCDEGPWHTVISLAAEVYLTDEPNEVAVRIREVRAGRLPLPLKGVLDRVTAQARDRNLPLRWTQHDADPVALIPIPVEHEQYRGHQLLLDAVSLGDGSLLLTGHTERAR